VDSKGYGLTTFATEGGRYHGDMTVAAGDVGKLTIASDFGSSIYVDGFLKTLDVKNGDLDGQVTVHEYAGKIKVGGAVTAAAEINVKGRISGAGHEIWAERGLFSIKDETGTWKIGPGGDALEHSLDGLHAYVG
jgi:hypothetical protein